MTKIKLPGSKSAVSPTVKLAVATVLILGVLGTLLWGLPPAATAPDKPLVRSNPEAAVVSMEKKEKVEELPKEGVHRYEMILARLTDDGETATGKVTLETYDTWAPIGVAHFDKLVTEKFYDTCRFFRVVDNFVVQFGINGDPAVQKRWRSEVLKDDPVKETNAYGTITYATSGPNSRTVQLFINTNKRGNKGLDGQGFAPFGRITSGMEFVERINNEYKQLPNQGKIQNQGNAYLDREFPRLTYIEKVRLIA